MEAKIKLALPATTESGDIEHGLDLNELIAEHPAATYYVRVDSGSFEDMKIRAGDILVVDRAIESFDHRIVVATLDGDFIVRRVHVDSDGTIILTSQTDDDPVRVTEEMDFTIFGVVTYTIHKCIS